MTSEFRNIIRHSGRLAIAGATRNPEIQNKLDARLRGHDGLGNQFFKYADRRKSWDGQLRLVVKPKKRILRSA
jgi:hypothetical protein